MIIFISGTDTNIGKTIISSWLALQTGFAYFKPIQTGTKEGTDSKEVSRLSNVKIYPEIFLYKEPLSPHLAAKIENEKIDIEKIILPQKNSLIVEGAGGLLVPINEQYLIIDLIKKLQIPVILVSHTRLGTINHTLLSLEALRSRNIEVLGIIMNGQQNKDNKESIEKYGNIEILAEFPLLNELNYNKLKNITLPKRLEQILIGKKSENI